MAEPVGVGIVGAGNVLWAYLQLLDRLVARGAATAGPICARREETRARIRRSRPGATLVGSAEEVLDAPDVDLVLIITPPDSHLGLVTAALEAGKHVVVEKPIASTRAEAEPAVALARSKDLVLLAAPFVQLSPSYQQLGRLVRAGTLGRVHSARALYGNAGSHWAEWYHRSGVGPLAEIGIYNLKSLTGLLGPVAEVSAFEASAVPARTIGGAELTGLDPDVCHLLLRHEDGALSSVVASHAIQRYRRPAVELYGDEGTANLLGDDWDPTGLEVWNGDAWRWEEYEPADATWLWTDGLREAVAAVREGREPFADPEQDLHLLDVIEAAAISARDGRPVRVDSSHALPAFPEADPEAAYVHDHTRPPDEQ